MIDNKETKKNFDVLLEASESKITNIVLAEHTHMRMVNGSLVTTIEVKQNDFQKCFLEDKKRQQLFIYMNEYRKILEMYNDLLSNMEKELNEQSSFLFSFAEYCKAYSSNLLGNRSLGNHAEIFSEYRNIIESKEKIRLTYVSMLTKQKEILQGIEREIDALLNN